MRPSSRRMITAVFVPEKIFRPPLAARSCTCPSGHGRCRRPLRSLSAGPWGTMAAGLSRALEKSERKMPDGQASCPFRNSPSPQSTKSGQTTVRAFPLSQVRVRLARQAHGQSADTLTPDSSRSAKQGRPNTDRRCQTATAPKAPPSSEEFRTVLLALPCRFPPGIGTARVSAHRRQPPKTGA